VWPGIVTIPTGMFAASKARRAEAEFATACEKAGLDLDGPQPDLRVLYEEVFTRIAYSGWLGLAEGYMAGEWESDNLVRVLTGLLEVGYRPRCGKLEVGGLYLGEEIPDSLVRLYSGDGMSTHGPVFSSGVPTTERVYMKSYVPGAGKKDEPGQHFVDITELSPPTLVERADLGDAQVRAAVGLLDAAHVGIGTHVLDFPSSGATIPIAAARRSATVDVLSSDAQQVADVQDVVAMAGVDSWGGQRRDKGACHDGSIRRLAVGRRCVPLCRIDNSSGRICRSITCRRWISPRLRRSTGRFFTPVKNKCNRRLELFFKTFCRSALCFSTRGSLILRWQSIRLTICTAGRRYND